MILRKLAMILVPGVLVVSAAVIAQDEINFESLLQEISQPPPATSVVSESTAPEPPPAAPVEAAAEVTTEAVVATEAVVTEAAEATTEAVADAEAAVTETAEQVTEAVAEPVFEEPAPEVVEEVPAEVTEQAVEVVEEPAAEIVEEAPAMEEVVVEEAVVEEEVVVTEEVPAYDAEQAMEEPAPEVEFTEAVEMTEEAPAEEVAVEEGVEEVVVTEEVAAEEAATEEVSGEVPAEAMALAEAEEIRRQAREEEGRKSLETGEAALAKGDYETAIKELDHAVQNIPERPATKKQRDLAKKQLSDAFYNKAMNLYRKRGDMQDARNAAERAQQVNPERKDIADLLKRIAVEDARQEKIAATPIPVRERPAIVLAKKTNDDLLKEARQFYKIKDFNAAEALYEQVLINDEYNTEAMRYLRKIDELRYKIRTTEREATLAGMIEQVRDTWNPPIRRDVKLPDSVTDRTRVETVTGAQKLQAKMEKIIIPSIEFRQANINDVVNFLVDASVQGDPEGVGVNIILKLGNSGGEATAPAPVQPTTDDFGSDPFGSGFDSPAAPTVSPLTESSSSSTPSITLNLRRVSLLNAIKYITEVAGLKYRMDENAVIITPEGAAVGRIVTRLYPVQPSILDVVVQREESAPEDREGDFVQMNTGSTKISTVDVKDFFQKAGVPFPTGSSITYNKGSSQLIVANTLENLELFERILSQINVVPNQVEIEARFVEIAQDDLEELGLQWILTDDYEIAQKKGLAGPAGTEMIQANADPDGFTKALRFFNFNPGTGTAEPLSSSLAGAADVALGGILSFSSVLTNPEVTVVLQAISQHGGSDLLSAPKVTTKSGVNAEIQVVTEIIYPTEFETSSFQGTLNVSGDSATANLATSFIVTPTEFQTRETGVILNVTPTVGADGYTIDLTMVPEVSELVDWIQYGTAPLNIPQPIFASRNVTTSIVVWDGQTVVMGGLIREDLIRVKDKIPILGDIPLLGRLFRSEGESSRKKNLLIFVTARLVGPDGKPLHRGEKVGVTDTATVDSTVAP